VLLVLGPGQVQLIVQRAQGHVRDSVLNEIALVKSAKFKVFVCLEK